MEAGKRKASSSVPERQCFYGADCYRRNPTHFREYSHPHLERLLADSPSADDIRLPDELLASAEIIREQLKILAELYPDLPGVGCQTPDKQPKPEAANSGKTAVEALFAMRREKMRAADAAAEAAVAAKAATAPEAASVAKATSDDSSAPTERRKPPAPTHPTMDIHKYFPVVAPRGRMADKLAAAAPYNFFLSTVTASAPTHQEPLSVTFQELLDPSLGPLQESAQLNFMVDIGWLLAHYYFAGYRGKPLLVLYGDDSPDPGKMAEQIANVKTVRVQVPSAFGVHHTKMGLYLYEDGSLRVVISTANLYEDDWHNRTQGLWISPTLPPVPANAEPTFGAGPTGFRDDLVEYLSAYKLSALRPWIDRIKRIDFSAVKVFLVASVPGSHSATPNGPPWGHPRVGYLLAKHSAPISEQTRCPIVAQSSSIGSLGPTLQSWVGGEVLNSFRRSPNVPMLGQNLNPGFRMIFPSYSNVLASHDGYDGGNCLPYQRATDERQPWLKEHLHQWRSAARHRTRAVPHIKSYCRWSEQQQGLYWFLLTSANLSKAAWGTHNKKVVLQKMLRINSYEAGVLFLPLTMIGASCFPMQPTGSVPPFPMPYDVPLTGYALEDTPFAR